MKRIVTVCGLIAGAIVSILMMVSIYISYNKGHYDGSMVVGYAAMLLAFSLIFVGIKNYRDKYNNGVISFGKAFKTGLFITLIASTIYVAVWLVSYYLFIPDFMDKYTAELLTKAKAEGATPAEIISKTEEMEGYKEMYKNPFVVILFTYLEILPVGLVVTVICSLLLKRRSNGQMQLASA